MQHPMFITKSGGEVAIISTVYLFVVIYIIVIIFSVTRFFGKIKHVICEKIQIEKKSRTKLLMDSRLIVFLLVIDWCIAYFFPSICQPVVIIILISVFACIVHLAAFTFSMAAYDAWKSTK